MPVVFITGAANGIGKELSAFFLSKNYKVVAADISYSKIFQSGNVLQLPLDVRDISAWENAKKEAISRLKAIDIFINNAGVIHPEFGDQLSTQHIDNQIDVNLKGVIYGSKIAVGMFKNQGFGHLINVSSLAGVAPIQGLSVYSATKFAVRGFTLSIVSDLKKFNIHASVICPDLVATNMLTEQLEFEAANITFSGNKPLTTNEVVIAIWERAIQHKEVEILLPRSRGVLAKLGNAFPALTNFLTTSMQKKGRKQRLKMKGQ